MAEHAVVDRQADRRVGNLSGASLSAELPRQLAHLSDGLGRDCLTERSQPSRGIDRDSSADGRIPIAQELRRVAWFTEANVFIPIELIRGAEVVDLGDVEVVGAYAGLGVGGLGDLVLERMRFVAFSGPRVRCQIRHVDDGVGERRSHRADTRDAHRVVVPMGPGVVHTRDDECCSPIARGTNLQQPQRV